MVKPVDFQFNSETAEDNEFQKKPDINSQNQTQQALKEFNEAIHLLKQKNIDVIIYDKNQFPKMKQFNLPDAIFPNNWISTHQNGDLILYPMYAQNRELEKEQYEGGVKELLEKNNFSIKNRINFSYKNQILEGTGSLIIDHAKKRVYCSQSQRAQKEIFEEWCKQFNYEGYFFESRQSNGKPFYHTNILLCIGVGFAVFCPEAVPNQTRRKEILQKLQEERTVIEISLQQAESMCGNILQIQNFQNQQCIIMSTTAFNNFSQEQKSVLKQYGEIIAIDIPTIEKIGGGSARCTICEIFLPSI